MLSVVRVPDGGNPRGPSVSEVESKYAQNIQDLEGRLEEERLAIAKLVNELRDLGQDPMSAAEMDAIGLLNMTVNGYSHQASQEQQVLQAFKFIQPVGDTGMVDVDLDVGVKVEEAAGVTVTMFDQ